MRALVRQSLICPLIVTFLGPTLIGCDEEVAVPTDPASESGPPEAALSAAPAFKLVSAGWASTCGITTGNRAWCWGNNSAGQLGTFNRIKRLAAVPVKGDLPFDFMDAGDLNACALTTDDLAYCWGQNLPSSVTTQPKLVTGTRHFVQIAATFNRMCGITATGGAWCRGVNNSGQVGDGTLTDRAELVRVAGELTFRQISTSPYHSCAVTVDDRAYCWGENAFGMLGDGNGGGGLEPLPKAVAGGLRFRSISAGYTFTCAVATDDRGYCWGSNIYGQLGDETLTDHYVPMLVHGGKRWRQIEAGNSHVCGITLEGKAFCWGRDAEGQLGTGARTGISVGQKPQAVAGGLVWSRISAGGLHSCGVTTTNVGYCWGYNEKGEVGDGTQTARLRPTKVLAEG